MTASFIAVTRSSDALRTVTRLNLDYVISYWPAGQGTRFKLLGGEWFEACEQTELVDEMVQEAITDG